jgi:hypothetical protein
MKNIANQLSDGLQWVADALARLSIRRDYAPLDTVERLFQFVSTRSALVAQKKLYGYLKERMGLRYPKEFENDAFVRSIDIAKMQVFAASLSDLTVFAMAHMSANTDINEVERRAMAIACYAAAMRDNAGEAPDQASLKQWTDDFRARADAVHWANVAAGESPFTESPKALYRWAPIADELKKYDREIVENSIRFAWNEVTQDYRKRIDAAAVVRDWESPAPS